MLSLWTRIHGILVMTQYLYLGVYGIHGYWKLFIIFVFRIEKVLRRHILIIVVDLMMLATCTHHLHMMQCGP